MGKQVKHDPKEMFAVRLRLSLKRQLKKTAVMREMTVEQFVDQALVDAIRGRRAPRGVTE